MIAKKIALRSNPVVSELLILLIDEYPSSMHGLYIEDIVLYEIVGEPAFSILDIA